MFDSNQVNIKNTQIVKKKRLLFFQSILIKMKWGMTINSFCFKFLNKVGWKFVHLKFLRGKMFAASTYEEIVQIERNIENREIVVFLFVRPTNPDAMNIINEFEYIHYN